MILLYHGVVGDFHPRERWCLGQALPLPSVERQIRWLARRFRILPLPEYLDQLRKTGGKPRGIAALTFDDGVGSAFRRVFPFLEENRIPATFFISTGHLRGGRLLWFCYLNALCFENVYEEVSCDGQCFPLRTLAQRIRARRALEGLARRRGDLSDFAGELERAYTLPRPLEQEYGGMSEEQLRVAGDSPLLEIGSHSVTHPFLSRQPRAAQAEEITQSKSVLSRLTGRNVRYFAYPAGDYDRETLDLLKEAGFQAAFATISRNLGSDEMFELDRIGIYSVPLWKVKLKAWGAVDAARRIGLRVG